MFRSNSEFIAHKSPDYITLLGSLFIKWPKKNNSQSHHGENNRKRAIK